MSFTTLNLHQSIQQAVDAAGYTTPTEIQTSAIPVALEGKDILASAQTGTGKTAAFTLPILHRLVSEPVANRKELHHSPRALILSPTRELAQQVNQSCQTYGQFIKPLKVVSITGGVPFDRQKRKLNAEIDVMIATPGRLIDCLNRRLIDVKNVQFLVLDEADRMLDMGFIDDVRKIICKLPVTRQTMLFSATIDKEIERLVADFMQNPISIKTSTAGQQHQSITQQFQYVNNLIEKSLALKKIIAAEDIDQSIIFTATKESADLVATMLSNQGQEADAIHGDMRQNVRNKIITKFKNKELKFLVGTDLVARGIDVPGVSHVINYDLPREVESYVHRIGRTGRASATGKAISLAYYQDFMMLRQIEKFIGHKIEEINLPGLGEGQTQQKSQPTAGNRRLQSRYRSPSSGNRNQRSRSERRW